MASGDDEALAGLQLILPMIFGAVQGQLLAAAAELDIAEHLGDRSLPLSDLSAATGTDPHALERVMDALVSLGVFTGDAQNGYACAAAGKLLRRSAAHSVHHYALMNNREWLLRVLPQLTQAMQSGTDEFATVHGTSCYEYLTSSPSDGAIFQAALTALSRQDANALTTVYDFGRFKRVVDVGGGEGLLISQLLDAYPQLSGVLLDFPGVVAGGEELLGAQLAAGRCEIVGGDFRDRVPADGDCYVLKRVVSTCPPADIDAALGHIRAGISPTGRLLVIDPDPESVYGRLMDILMLVATGGHLQSVTEISATLATADFEIHSTMSTDTGLQVIEAAPNRSR